jgi:hypothetical protein
MNALRQRLQVSGRRGGDGGEGSNSTVMVVEGGGGGHHLEHFMNNMRRQPCNRVAAHDDVGRQASDEW